MKPVVTVTNLFPEKALEKLSLYCDLRTNQTENSLSASALAKIASESFVMITYLSDKIDSAIIDKASNLKLIANSEEDLRVISAHLQDAIVFLQYCIDGILHIATQIKI